MLLLTLAKAAHAGCPVDTDRDARRAAATVVVTGTIVAIELVEGSQEVVEWLHVDREIRGHVLTGALLLHTEAPTHDSCGAPPVFGVGERVYAIGGDWPRGDVPVSACTGDVGRLGKDAVWLDAFAGAGDHTLGARSGLTKWLPGRPEWPEPPRMRLRAILPSGTWEGGLLSEGDNAATAVFTVGQLDVIDTVPEALLDRVIIHPEPVVIGGELLWRPGTHVGPDAIARIDGPIRAAAALMTENVGKGWEPAPAPPRPRGGEGFLFPVSETELRTAPDGDTLAVLAKTADGWPGYQLLPDGPAEGDWLPVYLDSPALVGRAWVRRSDVRSVTSMEWSSRGESTSEVRVQLPEGVEVRDPATGDVFARSRRAWVRWLTRSGDRAWVVIDTPNGRRVGEISCTKVDCPR